ncbi:MAG TPA: hypothetical protein VGE39_05250 [Prosthecobacter sp.]
MALRRQEAQELVRAGTAHAPLAAGAQDTQARRTALAEQIVQQNREGHARLQDDDAVVKSYDPAGDGRYTRPEADHAAADRALLAQMEKEDHPMAADVRAAMRTDAIKKVDGALGQAFPPPPSPLAQGMPAGPGAAPGVGVGVGVGTGAGAQPAAASGGTGAGRPLFEALGGTATSGSFVAKSLASSTFGVTDAKGVHIAPTGTGAYALSTAPQAAPGAPGTGKTTTQTQGMAPARPFAVYDREAGTLTLQADAQGQLGAEARRLAENHVNIRSDAAGGGGASLIPLYGPGGQPRKTEAEVQAMRTAGEQAVAALGADASPEARADALAQAGLSPEGLRQQFQQGRISLQQSIQLNQQLNGISEVNPAQQGSHSGLNAWASQPRNPMGAWAHDGSPEQQAVATNRYYDALAKASQGSILTSPQRIEELRREALGAINPGWKAPGSATPGGAPKDGPAGFERIPGKDGTHTLITSGTWKVEDVAKAHTDPTFAQATQAERDAVMNDILSQSFTDYTARPGFGQQAYQEFGRTAQQARDQSAALKTWAETGGDLLGAGKGLLKDALGTGAALLTDTIVKEPDGQSRMPMGNVLEQASFWGKSAWDLGKRNLPGNRPAHNQLRADLDALHEDLKNGNFPLTDPAQLSAWTTQRNQTIADSQKGFYVAVDGTPDLGTAKGLKQHIYTHTNNLLHPANAELMATYIRTRDEAVWKQLSENLMRPPGRAAIDEARDKSLENSQLVNFMSQNYGMGDYKQHMISAGNPLDLAANFIPLARGLRAGKEAAEAGVQAGKAGLKGAAAELSKSVAIDLAAGTLQTFIDNPEAGMAELVQAGKENIAAALGLHIAGRGAGHAYGKAKGLFTGEGQPGAGQAPAPGQAQAPGAAPTPAPPPPNPGGTGGTAPAPTASSGGPGIPGTATNQGSPPSSGKPSSTTVNNPSSAAELRRTDGQPTSTTSSTGGGDTTSSASSTTSGTGTAGGSATHPVDNGAGGGGSHDGPASTTSPSSSGGTHLPGTATYPSSGHQPSTTVTNGQPPSTASSSSGGSLPPGASATTTGHASPRGIDSGTPPSNPPGQQPPTTVNNPSSVAELRRTDGQPPSTPPSGPPSPATANNRQPPQTPSAPSAKTHQPGPPLDVEGSKRLIANLDKERAHHPLHPKKQADYDQARQVVAKDTVERLQKQTTPLTDAQKQEMADALNTLGAGPSGSGTPGTVNGTSTSNGTPDRAPQPGGTNPRGIELPGGRRTGGPQDSNLVPASGGDGPNKPLQGGAAAALPPAATGNQPPAAVGQMINGSGLGVVNVDAPRASADGGAPANSPPNHLTPVSPPDKEPDNITYPSSESPQVSPAPAGPRKRPKDKFMVPPGSKRPLNELAEQDQLIVRLTDEVVREVYNKGEGATMSCVAYSASTGRHFADHSRDNDSKRQPTEIDDRLKLAVKGQTSLYKHPITNCAEFNAVNQALQAGIAPEDIILRTIYTDTLKNKIPCLNCQPWIDKLGIRVINGDYAY